MRMSGGRRSCALHRYSPDAAQTVGDQGVGPLLDPRGYLGVRGPAVRWIVFEAAKARRIVRGRDYNAVCQSALAAAVVAKDRVRNYRGRRISSLGIHHHLDAVGRQYLQGGPQRGP